MSLQEVDANLGLGWNQAEPNAQLIRQGAGDLAYTWSDIESFSGSVPRIVEIVRHIESGIQRLTTMGINLETIGPATYNFIRNEAAVTGNDSNIATGLFCFIAGPVAAKMLDDQLQVRFPDGSIRAYAEYHDPSDSSLDDIDHCYAVVGALNGDPEYDIIVDPTYKQFLRPDIRGNLPNVFVGSRAEAATLMENYATNTATKFFYDPSTASQGYTAEFTGDYETSFRSIQD